MEHCKPWWILISLGFKLQPPLAAGVETQLVSRGEKLHYCLESAKEFADAVDAVPPEEYVWQLEAILQRQADLRPRFLRLYECWINRDLDAMDRLTTEFPFGITPLLRKAVFEDRNRKWLDTLSRLFKHKERVLVAVGALHLGGAGNMVQLARDGEHPLISLL